MTYGQTWKMVYHFPVMLFIGQHSPQINRRPSPEAGPTGAFIPCNEAPEKMETGHSNASHATNFLQFQGKTPQMFLFFLYQRTDKVLALGAFGSILHAQKEDDRIFLELDRQL